MEKSSHSHTSSLSNQIVDPTKNVEDLVNREIQHVKEIIEIHRKHENEMRMYEAQRLDSIRQVDVSAVKREADRSLEAIQTLATQTQTNAENLRTVLNVTAERIAKQLADTIAQLVERISALEKSSYEGKGKEAVKDPQIDDLIRAFKDSQGTKSQGQENVWQKILQAAILIGFIIDIVLRFK